MKLYQKLPSTSSSAPAKKPQKKKSKKKKSGVKKEDGEYVEYVQEANKLKAKFSSKKKSKDYDMAFLKSSIGRYAIENKDKSGRQTELDLDLLRNEVGSANSDVTKVRNSQTHNNLIKRAEETQINKIFQIEIRPDAVQTLWMCALCHQRSAQDDLGDLFGPYYVNIRPEVYWPSFLFKKSLKLPKNETYCADVWFHGDCLLWAPGIQMKGNQLTCLEERLRQFWKQNCWICKNSGAAINVDNKFVHFGCAKKHGYKMNRHLLSIES